MNEFRVVVRVSWNDLRQLSGCPIYVVLRLLKGRVKSDNICEQDNQRGR